MSKRVAIAIPGRDALLPIEILSSEILTEFSCLQQKFLEYASSDPYLANKLKTHFPIYEYFDPEFGCDMQVTPSEEKLPTKMKVRFVPNSSPAKPSSSNSLPMEEATVEGFQYLEQASNNVVIEFLPADQQTIVGGEQNTDKNADFGDSSGDFEYIEIPSDQQHLIKTKANSTAKNTEQKIEIYLELDDITQPQFSREVMEHIKSGRVMRYAYKFVHEAGDHLKTLKERPKKRDFETYVKYLLTTIPEIDQKVSGPEEAVGELLYTMIRNYVLNGLYRKCVPDDERKRSSFNSLVESRQKRAKLKESEVNLEPKEKKARKQKDKAFDPENPCACLTKKKFVPAQIIEVLPLFTEVRRNAVLSKEKFPTLKSLLSLWPVYQNPEVIKAEFLLCCGITEHRMEVNFNKMIERLGEVYSMPFGTESEKIRLLNHVEDDIEINFSKTYPKAFSFEELGTTQKPKVPGKILANAPVSVSYISSEGNIQKCYVLGECKMICSVDVPTAFGVYKLLVGAYYAYGCKYPLVSKNTFDFLDFAVLETTNKNSSPKLVSLKKKYCQ